MIVETLLFILHTFTVNFPFRLGTLGGNEPSSGAGNTNKHKEDAKTCFESNSEPSEKKRKKFTYKTEKLGVWELKYTQSSRFSGLSGLHLTFLANVRLLRENWPLVIQFLTETYAVAPKEVLCYLTHSLWQSLQGSLTMYFTSRLLELIGNKLEGKEIDQALIIKVIAQKILVSFITNVLLYLVGHDIDILKNKMRFAYLERALRAALKVELPMSQDPVVISQLSNMWSIKYSGRESWDAFSSICGITFAVTRVGSQILMTFALIRKSQSGMLFMAMCSIKPLVSLLLGSSDSIEGSYIAYCVEPAFKRMASLFSLAFQDQFREDRLSDGAAQFIEKEYNRSRTEVGDKNTQDVMMQRELEGSVYKRTMEDVLGDLPLFIFSISLLFFKNMSVTSLTQYQQMQSTISSTVSSIRWELRDLSGSFKMVKEMYDLDKLYLKFKDGTIDYPLKDNSIENTERGAQIEFRNVSFTYPEATKSALEDISFTIKPGQMVVIVGVNGSGKSSTVKLFNRLYEPTSGTILLDGRPLGDYKVADVRRTMAILRQDHSPYPVSLFENIALGRPGEDVTKDDVISAARFGGAASFIEKLEKRYETVLHPVTLADYYMADDEKDEEELKKQFEGLEKWTNVSGGESQRLAASRTFMRLSDGRTRFLVADEPTSALDPEGEYNLFSQLRELRGKMTLVFITHRFGHLTKFADLILCMKDGALVEQGTHDELIAKRGEYFNLHDVQARAFV